MKLAVTGKGGAGKTTTAAALSLLFAEEGRKVIAIDADPDSNLAATLGFPNPDSITPIAGMKELIKERAGEAGVYFKLNPKVDDIPDKYCITHKGIKLLVMGGLKKAGSGCYCLENAFLKSLIAHLLLARDDVVIMDMEAGIEHLGRGTASGVDALLVVVEPGMRSMETAQRIRKMAGELKIKHTFLVGNRVRGKDDISFIEKNTKDFDRLGFILYNEALLDTVSEKNAGIFSGIKEKLLEKTGGRNR